MDEAHDGPEPDHSLGDLRKRFVVDQQAAAVPTGSEGLLDTPALRQQDKALGKVGLCESGDVISLTLSYSVLWKAAFHARTQPSQR
jgi:hypothetical protein